MKKTQAIVTNCKYNNDRITAFIHPTTNQVVVSAPKHAERHKVCDKLFEELGFEEFKFKNQSYTQIGKDWLKGCYGEIPKSQYSNDAKEIFMNYKIRPYICRVQESFNQNEGVQSFDIRGCHAFCMRDNKHAYPIYSAFDQVQPFDGVIKPGQYFIDRDVYFGGGTIRIPFRWLPHNLVDFALQIDAIKPEDIKYQFVSSFTLDAEFFKQWVDDVKKIFPGEEGKSIINTTIGDFGVFKQKDTEGAFTDSEPAAGELYTQEKAKGRDVQVYALLDYFFVRSDSVTVLDDGHGPIYRQIIAAEYIQLERLYNQVVGPATQVIAYHTDSIKVINPLETQFKKKKDCQLGDIHEEGCGKIKGTPIQDLRIVPKYKFGSQLWNEINESEIEDFKGCCMVDGAPGSGKTTTLADIVKDRKDYIALAPTNKAVNVLISRGVKACTFDSFFYSPEEDEFRKSPIKQVANKKLILVDELSMCTSKHLYIILLCKRAYPDIQIMLFGDMKQLPPVERKWFDYKNNKTIMEICDYNRCTIQYKSQLARFTEDLNDTRIEFDNTSRIPKSCKHKVNTETFINICSTNAECAAINKKMIPNFMVGKKAIKVMNRVMCVGMPLVVKKGNLKAAKIANSEFYDFVKVDGNNVIVKETDSEDIRTVPIDWFHKIFRLSFWCYGSQISGRYYSRTLQYLDFSQHV
jgi:hypothetical protein